MSGEHGCQNERMRASAAKRLLPVLVPLLATGLLGLSACSSPAEPAGREQSGCITDFDPDTDYFEHKSEITEAQNFSISYHRSYQVLTVNQPSPGAAPERYVLVQCGAPEPELSGELTGAQVISTPVASLFSGSTTQLVFLSELDDLDVLTGVANVSFISDPDVVDYVKSHDVPAYASGDLIDTEQVLAASPSALITDGTENEAYPALRRGGVPVVSGADFIEATPLGRAEWIKMIAALTRSEERAGALFGGLRTRYRELAASVAGAPPAQLLTGSMFQGVWSMPTGGSYAGRLLTDAGGTWPWQGDQGTAALQLSLEDILARGADAPIWLVIDNQWTTTADVLAADPRYRSIRALTDGQVWNANNAMGPGGGNNYFELGVARPDLILGDLIAILHPGTETGHEFVFYRRLTA